MKKRILIGILTLVLALAIAVPGVVQVAAANGTSTLTVNYNTGMNGNLVSSGTGTNVTGLSVYLKTAAGADVASKGGVTGSTTFTGLASGDYKVVSVKGASTTTEDASVASDQYVNIHCGKLVVNYNTGMNGDLGSSGSGTNVTGLSVYIKWATNNGDVASQGGVNGSTSFALLSGAYKVVSVKGASTTTEDASVASDQYVNIHCGKLVVTYYANNKAEWGMTGLSVYVKWAANNGDVDSKGGVNNETSFALLSGAYKVVSVKGASSRTDSASVASSQTLDVPVARFRVAVVKAADFSAQTGVSVYVKTAGNGDVTSAGGVNGNVDFSLLQSDNGGGAGQYKFIAVKNSSTAQTQVSANEVPPPGLAGVILMIP